MNSKPSKIGRIYGYAVCLITLVTILTTCNSLIGAWFDLSEPLLARDNYASPRGEAQLNLSSFESYKATALGIPALKDLEEADLQSKYEASRDNKIRTVRHRSHRTLTVSGLILALSLLLFVSHWLWMRRLTGIDE